MEPSIILTLWSTYVDSLKKTKNIIFNFSKQSQFTTDIVLEGEKLETVKETMLLGTYITDDLKWDKNTEYLVKKANQRMKMLQIASKFRGRSLISYIR